MNRVLRAVLQALLKPAGRMNQGIYRNDFDRCASVYDQAATRTLLAEETVHMIESAGLLPGMNCIDLGCGTGHSSEVIIERITPGGMLISCDFSPAMIDMTRKRIGERSGFSAVATDIISFMNSLPAASVDYTGSFWSMEYCNHAAVVRQIARILKSGGRVSVIANYRDSLDELQDLVSAILIRNPLSLRAIPPLNFLSGAAEFESIAKEAGLKTVSVDEKEIPFTFSSGKDLVQWMKTGGPCAGFRGALRENRSDRVFELIRDAADLNGGLTVTFRFLRYTGEK